MHQMQATGRPLEHEVARQEQRQLAVREMLYSIHTVAPHLGGWPPKEFESLSDADRAAFWADLKESGDEASQTQCVMKHLAQKIIESRIGGDLGHYWPLSVYDKKGFNIKDIERNCKDTQDHPVLGLCYRVDIRYMDKKTEHQRIRKEILESIKQRQQERQNHATGAGKGAGKGAGAKGRGRGRGLAAEMPPAPTSATRKMSNDAVKILAKVFTTMH